jgi:hypothetical protein
MTIVPPSPWIPKECKYKDKDGEIHVWRCDFRESGFDAYLDPDVSDTRGPQGHKTQDTKPVRCKIPPAGTYIRYARWVADGRMPARSLGAAIEQAMSMSMFMSCHLMSCVHVR